MLRCLIRIAFAIMPLMCHAQVGGTDSGRSFTLVFTGDVMLGRDVAKAIDHLGADRLFCAFTDSLFATADAVVANLECPATSVNAPLNKRFVFRANPDSLPALRRHGITHLNLANNHSIDHGREGLADTHRNIIASGMTPLGYGATAAEAARPALIATAPRPIYVLSSLRVMSENYVFMPQRPSVCEADAAQLCDTIRALRRRDPTACVIVCLHWGVEHAPHPQLEQRQEARQLIDAGADAIIGHHTHSVQDVEVYRGRPIFYSLGNFIFDTMRPSARQRLFAKLTVTADSMAHQAIAGPAASLWRVK